MVKNIDRMSQEIRSCIATLPTRGLDPEFLEQTLLEVVDTVDRHEIKALSINKEVRALVLRLAADMEDADA